MELSMFTDKAAAPGEGDLRTALGKSFAWWQDTREYVFAHCPAATEEWNYSKAGWNYRIKDKKRVIVYLMPGKGAFRASFALGGKAIADLLASDISDEIRNIIATAKTYAEGTGVRINVAQKKTIPDIKKLVDVKLKY